jgi:hypothetical protein
MVRRPSAPVLNARVRSGSRFHLVGHVGHGLIGWRRIAAGVIINLRGQSSYPRLRTLGWYSTIGVPEGIKIPNPGRTAFPKLDDHRPVLDRFSAEFYGPDRSGRLPSRPDNRTSSSRAKPSDGLHLMPGCPPPASGGLSTSYSARQVHCEYRYFRIPPAILFTACVTLE